MKAPISKKAKKLLNQSTFDLVKKLLVGSKNGMDKEGHLVQIGEKKYNLKKVSSENIDL